MQPAETDSQLSSLQIALNASLECSRIVELMNEVLILLTQKRRTLEEKAIAEYFHKSIIIHAGIICKIHQWANEAAAEPDTQLFSSVFEKLQTVNEKLRIRVEELLKVVRYNLNYLEQYFEYDFYTKLTAEPPILADLEAVLQGMQEIYAQAEK